MKTSRRGAVDPFIVMDVVAAASRLEAQGRSVVHMEVGQPGTPAPAAARAALRSALETGPLGYTVSLGLPELRAGIAELYRRWYGLEIDPARIVVTAGASGALVLAATLLFDAGAEVGVTEPGYPSYRQILRALDLRATGLPTRPETGHRLTPGDLPARLDGLIVASPANPTGVMLDRAAFGALAEAAAARGAVLISDEIYHGLYYDAPAVSALEVEDRAIVIGSFSKYFSMTGWRVGWMVMPPDLVRGAERLLQNLFICACHASQRAALAALEAVAELDAHRGVYARNRDLLLARLPRIGFDRLSPPDGAFYIYAEIDHLTADSRHLAADILDRAGVALTPGVDFDPVRGAGTLRLSYAGPTEVIAEGLARLERYFAGAGSPGDRLRF